MLKFGSLSQVRVLVETLYASIDYWLDRWAFNPEKRVRFSLEVLFCRYIRVCPYRLTARTSAFHAGNRGSIPRGVTRPVKPSLDGFFCVVRFTRGIEPEGGRGNICFPVEEGLGKPWVSEE